MAATRGNGESAAPSGDWAICCSGGGIRSASFCLGGLQRLQEGGFLDKASHIVSVSGGTYIAASMALVASGLADDRRAGGPAGSAGADAAGPRGARPDAGGAACRRRWREALRRCLAALGCERDDTAGEGDDEPRVLPAYAPGTPEELNLRDNTRYLLADGKTLLVAGLSQLVGAIVTFILVFAPVFAAAHAWGWLLRWRKVLTPAGAVSSARATPLAGPAWDWTWWVIPAALGGLTLVLFAWWWSTAPTADHRDRRTGIAKATGWSALATAVAAAAMLGVPALVAWLSQHLGKAAPPATGALGWGSNPGQMWATFAGVAAAVKLVADSAESKLKGWRLIGGKGQGAVPDVGQSGVAAKVGNWLRVQLLPWLASLLIVVAVAVAGLLWVRVGATAGYSREQLIPVVVALAVVAGTRLLADVNRISMHDFYRWRLAGAFAVVRNIRREGEDVPVSPTRQAALPVLPAPGALLSGLSGVRPKPVICATANITAEREVPVGRGGIQLTFDPVHVRLRGQGDAESAVAAMADFETLVGRRRLTLFDICAISGAAVSPLMGAATRQAYRILFTMANVRLGVWLPHPAVVAAARRVLTKPDPKDAEDWKEWREWRRTRYWWNALIRLLWYVLPHNPWDKGSGGALREARLWAYVLNMRGEKDKAPDGRLRLLGRWIRRRGRSVFGAICHHAMQPTLGLLWAEAVGHTSYRSTWIYATDGGHYDDLGVVEALRLGADNLVVLDASGDKAHTWFGLGGTVAIARTDARVDIDIDPTEMIRPAHGTAEKPDLKPGEVVRPWASGDVYRLKPGRPDRPSAGPARRGAGGGSAAGPAPDGVIWVCKLGWWKDAPWDVRAYAAAHAEFPGQSTMQQLYDGAEFDAYRELGVSAVAAAIAEGALPDGAQTRRGR